MNLLLIIIIIILALIGLLEHLCYELWVPLYYYFGIPIYYQEINCKKLNSSRKFNNQKEILMLSENFSEKNWFQPIFKEMSDTAIAFRMEYSVLKNWKYSLGGRQFCVIHGRIQYYPNEKKIHLIGYCFHYPILILITSPFLLFFWFSEVNIFLAIAGILLLLLFFIWKVLSYFVVFSSIYENLTKRYS